MTLYCEEPFLFFFSFFVRCSPYIKICKNMCCFVCCLLVLIWFLSGKLLHWIDYVMHSMSPPMQSVSLMISQLSVGSYYLRWYWLSNHFPDGISNLQLKKPSHPSRGIPTAISCLATLLKEPVVRSSFVQADGVKLLVPLISPASTQQSIQVNFVIF